VQDSVRHGRDGQGLSKGVQGREEGQPHEVQGGYESDPAHLFAVRRVPRRPVRLLGPNARPSRTVVPVIEHDTTLVPLSQALA
jgi:hypothetical protein